MEIFFIADFNKIVHDKRGETKIKVNPAWIKYDGVKSDVSSDPKYIISGVSRTQQVDKAQERAASSVATGNWDNTPVLLPPPPAYFLKSVLYKCFSRFIFPPPNNATAGCVYNGRE